MSPEAALELINAELHTAYTLGEQYSGGADQGAYRVLSAGGAPAVLKTNRNPQWIRQVQRAQSATERLRQLGYPAPTYFVTGATDTGTYSLQSELPGAKVAQPTSEQLAAILALVELQKDQTIPEVEGQDWAWYVKDLLYRGDSTHTHALAQFSQETSALAFELKGLVAGLQDQPLRTTDIVHGDFVLAQVMFQGPAVSGVIDWDQVGRGDRTTDLMALWLSLINTPAARDAIMQHTLSVSNAPAIKLCAAHKLFLNVGWTINKVGGDVPAAISQARSALELLRQLA
jgi:aminoglycoside phosphotransferase